jgi:hypothetical protein
MGPGAFGEYSFKLDGHTVWVSYREGPERPDRRSDNGQSSGPRMRAIGATRRPGDEVHTPERSCSPSPWNRRVTEHSGRITPATFIAVVLIQALPPHAVCAPAATPHPSAVSTRLDQTALRASAVSIRRGDTTLGALLWRLAGRGPFPAILVNHGSGRTREDLARLGPYENQAQTIGPVFATHGYVLLFLFRHGSGPRRPPARTRST